MVTCCWSSTAELGLIISSGRGPSEFLCEGALPSPAPA